jgi:hypothetical protein
MTAQCEKTTRMADKPIGRPAFTDEQWAWAHARYGETVAADVALIDVALNRYDEPSSRLYALAQLERFWGAGADRNRGEFARNMLRAASVWRLRQQL